MIRTMTILRGMVGSLITNGIEIFIQTPCRQQPQNTTMN